MKFSLNGLLLSVGLLLSSAVAHAQSAAVHGMVLFGSEQLYVSHIPMYMTPHDYQAIAKVSISEAGLEAYKKANVAGGQTYFTLAPRPFVLPLLLNGSLKSFKADLYRGSFEQGGRVIASGITVNVDTVDYQARLSKATAPAASLTYLTLNDGVDSYLAHKITAPNNFDHIVKIKWLTPATEKEIESEIPTNVEVPSNTEISNDPILAIDNSNLVEALPEVAAAPKSFLATDRLTNRLKVGQLFTVLEDGTIQAAKTKAEASFEVVSDFYCTQGPDFFNPCN